MSVIFGISMALVVCMISMLVPLINSIDPLKKMLDDIGTEPKILYKQRYIGPRLHLRNKTIHFKCPSLFKPSEDQLSPIWPPLKAIPLNLTGSYTFDGLINIFYWHFEEKQNNGDGYDWPKDHIDGYVPNYKSHMFCYRWDWCQDAVNKYNTTVNDKVGMVVGSQHPWAEHMLINAGVKSLITMEYMRIKTDHPKLKTYTPDEVSASYLAGTWEPVDFVFSYSSLEHDGLGRYGDPMSPFADLESFARMHCLLKEDGIMFLGIPLGRDAVVFNAHRVYGIYRLFLLLTNWELIDVIGFNAGYWVIDDDQSDNYRSKLAHDAGTGHQPIMVLRKRKFLHHPDY